MGWIRTALAMASAALTIGCATLPPPEGRAPSTALLDTDGTRLGQATAPLVAAHPGKSGIHPLNKPTDAFAARAVLAAAADKSLDAQYYIWHGDQTGYLLFEALWDAANRGVRVRLLLDDANTAGLDETIATLDAHPNIEVRLYNPLVHRGFRALNFLTDFTRVNRRMHNKSFTVDSQVAIVGGRNVGNEYYGAGDEVVFDDLDVIAVGPAAREVSQEFDLYWASASAYPAAAIVGVPPPDGAARLEARFAANRADPASKRYLEALRQTPVLQDVLARKLEYEWTEARLYRDDPAKTLDESQRVDILLLTALLQAVGPPQRSLDLVSPYFVPGSEGAAALARLARSGVKVRVLTNSFAATDVAPVHAGYSKRRRDLLEAGVQLFELKSSVRDLEPEERRGIGGSSSASLHAKTFALDRERIFVGSFNFDPRSALLNTEMGLLIESPSLAQQLAKAFDSVIPRAAYEVRLTPDGELEWIERTHSGEVRHASEPGAGVVKRGWIGFLSILPIEWML